MLNAIEFARLRCVTKAIRRHALVSGSPSLSHGIRINSRNGTLARTG